VAIQRLPQVRKPDENDDLPRCFAQKALPEALRAASKEESSHTLINLRRKE